MEDLWARRKVGYLLDQIRANGEKKELVDEVVALAKKYGITTPYTSYLIVPDGPVPVAATGRAAERPHAAERAFNGGPAGVPAAAADQAQGRPSQRCQDFARPAGRPSRLRIRHRPGTHDLGIQPLTENAAKDGKGDKDELKALKKAQDQLETYNQADQALMRRDLRRSRRPASWASICRCRCKTCATRVKLDQTALAQRRRAATCLEFGGVWIDEGFNAKTKMVVVKAQSDAYFRILERHPVVKDVFRLGNHLVWVTPERHRPGRRCQRRQGKTERRGDRQALRVGQEVTNEAYSQTQARNATRK